MKAAHDDDSHVRKERRKLEESRKQLKKAQKEIKEKNLVIDELNKIIERASKKYTEAVQSFQEGINLSCETSSQMIRPKTKNNGNIKVSSSQVEPRIPLSKFLKGKRNVKTQTWPDDFPKKHNYVFETPCSPSLARAGRPGSKDLEIALRSHRNRKHQNKLENRPTSFLHAFFSKL